MVNDEIPMKLKKDMMKEAMFKWASSLICPCSDKQSLEECFIIADTNDDKGRIVFCYCIGKNTYTMFRDLTTKQINEWR